MAPIFDGEVSSLICTEESDGLFSATEWYGSEIKELEASHQRSSHNRARGGVGLASVLSEETLALMVKREVHHLPGTDYLKRLRNGELDAESRKGAIDWIAKVHDHFGFKPRCECLSVNYLDRVLSACDLPNGKAWMMQLLAVACLSLAAKMEETKVPLSVVDLQACDSKFVFEARTIQKMEIFVLSTLNWKLHSVTPLCFICHFLCVINDGGSLPRSLILQSIKLILTTTKGIDFLGFMPSELAAAVAVVVVGETKRMEDEQAVSFLTHVDKARVQRCVKLIHHLHVNDESVKDASGLHSSVPASPIGVLDAACLSYGSDDAAIDTFGYSSQNSPLDDTKRRKLNDEQNEMLL